MNRPWWKRNFALASTPVPILSAIFMSLLNHTGVSYVIKLHKSGRTSGGVNYGDDPLGVRI